jgi:hypothetical protein
MAAPQELQTFAGPWDLLANIATPTPPISVTFTGLTGGSPYTGVGLRLNYQLDALAAGTWANDVVVTITAPNGVQGFYRSPVQGFTTLPNVGGDFSLLTGPFVGVNPVGTWTFTFTDDFEDGPVGGVQASLSNVRIALLTSDAPTSSITLPTPDGQGAWSTATSTVVANQVRWFQLEVTSAINGTGLGNALDIDMVGSNLAPVNDASMGMWNSATGVLVAADDNFGPGELPQFSFGLGPRAASGDGQLYGGQDGNALAAGTYFIGVSGGNPTAYGNFYNITGGGANAGPITMRVRSFDSFTPLPPDQVYSDTVNVGVIGTSTPGTENVQTQTYTTTVASAVKWFRFSTPAGTDADPTYYLDIDTEGTAPGVTETTGAIQDTEIGVYTLAGNRIADDDDDGNGFRSALSFGDAVNIRPAIAPVAPAAAGLPRNGRDGVLAAGDYWLAVSTWNTTFGAANWAVSSTAAAAMNGERVVNFRSNLPAGPSCNSRANVAGANQSSTPDAQLTADDIIVFLGWYFGNTTGTPVAGNPASPANLLADVSGANQNASAPDGQLTADDIIVFLGFYFAGCP